MVDAEVGAELSKANIVELANVVGYEDAEKSESANYRLSNEVPHLLLGDPDDRLGPTHFVK